MSETSQTTSKAAWKRNKRHEVTLASGTEVTIEIPNLPVFIKTGQLPNQLVDAAIQAMQPGARVTREMVEKEGEFYNWLVSVTVKVPELTTEEVPDVVPFEDVVMLSELATRQRDLDALGHHIGGLHKVDDWRRFRGFAAGDEALPSL